MRQQQQELQAIAGAPETSETPAAERTSIVGGAARVEILGTFIGRAQLSYLNTQVPLGLICCS
jgi:hypothetical protein